MIEVLNNSLNPYFNVACEEYVLKNISQDCFFIWQNSPSLIVGKHQNSNAEINKKFVAENNIPVIRRISGGGTVFQDLGNINFSFITTVKNEQIINFNYFTQPIILLLEELGITAILNSRNNIFIGDNKITGTAAHIFKNRVIHHGTLLFSTSVLDLENAIDNDLNTYKDKAIKSVRNNVTNIYDHLNPKISIHVFKELLKNKISKEFNVETKYELTDYDNSEIRNLVKIKYQTWEWNYGYSPAYKFVKSSKDNKLKIEIEVKKGLIETVVISGDSEIINNMLNVEKILIGKYHNKEVIYDVLLKSGFIDNIFIENFLDCLI